MGIRDRRGGAWTRERAPWLRPPRTLKSDIRAEVIAADPKWPYESVYIEEYRFSSPDGRDRVFEANYKKRGYYGEAE